MKKTKPLSKSEEIHELVLRARFEYAYKENAERVAVAHASTGAYVRISTSAGTYYVEVYYNKIT